MQQYREFIYSLAYRHFGLKLIRNDDRWVIASTVTLLTESVEKDVLTISMLFSGTLDPALS